MPAPTEDDWGTAVDAVVNPQTPARANLIPDAGDSPDKAAKAIKLGTQVGVPPSIVHDDLSGWTDAVKQATDNQVVADNPALARHFANDPMAAKVSSDDVGPLSSFMDSAGSVLKHAASPLMFFENLLHGDPESIAAGLHGVAEGYETQNYNRAAAGYQSGLVGEDTLKGYEADIKQFPERTGQAGFQQEIGRFLGSVVSSAQVALPAAGAGFLVGNLPGAITGGTLGLSADMGVGASGSIYRRLDQDTNGNKISEGTKQVAAIAGGLATFGLAEYGGPAVGKMVGEAFTKAALEPAVHYATVQGMRAVTKAGLEGAALNGAMQLSSIVSEQFAKQFTGGHATVFNSPEERDNVLKEMTSAVISGALLFGTLRVFSLGGNVLVDKMWTDQSKLNKDNMDAAFEAGDATATKERSPEAATNALKEVDPHGTVSVPAEALAPHKNTFTYVPNLDAQLQFGFMTGGDVEIPAPDFVAKTPSETYKVLADDVRQGQVPTVNEAKEFGERTEPPAPTAGAEPVRPVWTGLGEQTALALDQQRKALWLDPIFKDGASFGMSEGDFAAYSKKLQDTQAAIAKEVFDAVSRAEKKVQSAEWKANETETARKVESDLSARPDLMADQYFRTGRGPDGEKTFPERLSKDAVDSLFTKDELVKMGVGGPASDALPRGMTSADGAHPDEMASLMGFKSGRAMIEALAKLETERRLGGETPAQQRARIFKEETDRRMGDKYGSLDSNVTDAALDALMSVKQIDIFHGEIQKIAEKIGERPMSKADLVSSVQAAFKELPGKKAADVEGFQRLVGKHGLATERALMKGDFAEAFKAKQRQVVNFQLAKEAMEFRKELGDKRDLFKDEPKPREVKEGLIGPKEPPAKTIRNPTLTQLIGKYARSKPPKVDPDFIDQIHGIMQRAGMVLKRKEDLGAATGMLGKAPLHDFIARQSDAGYELPIDPSLIDTGSSKLFKDMSVDEVRTFKDALTALDFVGTNIHNVEVAGEKLALSEAVKTFRANVDSLAQRELLRDPTIHGLGDAVANWGKKPIEKLKHAAYEWDAMNLKMEQLLDWTDKNDPQGVTNNVVTRPIQAAKHAELDLNTEYSAKIKELIDPEVFRHLNESVENTSLVDWYASAHSGERVLQDFTRREMISMALHTGSESNWAKLTAEFEYEGNKYSWARADVQAMLDQHMTKAEWDYVQGVWDIHDSLWPKVVENERNTVGVAPQKVESKGFDAAGGKYRGGYAPLNPDSRWLGPGEGFKRGIFNEGAFGQARPTRGYTERRTGAVYPLDLTFDRIPKSIRETIHDVTHREALINAAKFLDHTEVRRGIQNAFGPEYLNQVKPWLGYVANPGAAIQIGNAAMAGLDRVAGFVRQRLVRAQMLYRASTAIKHGTAMAIDTMGELNIAHPARALTSSLTHLYGNPLRSRERIQALFDESGELRNRMALQDRDIGAAMAKVQGKSGIWAWVIHHGGTATGLLDIMSAMPLYDAVKKDALANGKSLEDAIYIGEKAVRNAHGSHGAPDLSAIMRGNESQKLLTIAFGTFNHQYNRIRTAGRLFGESGRDLLAGDAIKAFSKFSRASMISFFYVGLMGAVEQIGKNTPEDKKESWAGWAAKSVGAQLLSTIPMVREVAGLIHYGKATDSTPMGQIANTMAQTYRDYFNKNPEKVHNGLRNAILTGGYLLGIPGTAQLGLTAQFLSDIEHHKQRADTPKEYLRGMAFGKSQPGRKP